MITATRFAISLFTSLLFFSAVCAQNDKALVVQDEKTQTRQSSVATVTAVAATGRVRFTAPASITRIQLQVFRESGEMLFDESNKGNVLDWTLQDGAGQHLGNGSYLCVVTVKSLSGRLSQRIGSVSVVEKQIELQRVDETRFSPAQQQAVGPIEENAALTILQAGETEATTVVAHDGTQGEINRSRGALSFRVGDFFSGTDREQMRLTEAGNLGIGTDKPQAKLDVAGVIRTSKGIEFDNGPDGTNLTKLTTTASGSLQQTLADGTIVPNATGTGTQNKIAKWTDNAGTLGDSVVTEASGNIGIGTPNPQAALHVIGNQFLKPVGATPTYQVLAGSDPSSTVMLTTDSSAFGWQIAPSNAASDTIVQVLGQGFAAVPNRGEFGIYPGADSNSAFKVIQRGGPELLRVNRNGNVGIGNTNPAAKFDVTGNINTSTQYNIGGSRVLSVPGSNTLVGANAGPNLTTGFNNSFFGNFAGANTTGGSSNSFFGSGAGSQNTGGLNSFFGSSAGAANQGNGNSFFGLQAGLSNTTGSNNASFGFVAGNTNTAGSHNTTIGAFADVGQNNLTNAGAIGARAFVTQSNSLVLGSIVDFNGATASTNVGIGTTAPTAVLDVVGTQPPPVSANIGTNAPPVLQVIGGKGGNTTGFVRGGTGASVLIQAGDGGDGGPESAFGGSITLQPGAIGTCNPASSVCGSEDFSSRAGNILLAPLKGRVGIGTSAPNFKLEVVDSSNGLRVRTTSMGGTLASFGATGDFIIDGPGARRFIVKDAGNVGIGTNNPAEKLHVSGGNVRWADSQLITEQGGSLELGGTTSLAGTGTPYIDFHFGPVGAPQDFNTRIINDADGRLTVFGSVRLDTLNPLGPGSTALCLDNDNIISNCVSSIRFKDHVVTLRSGLDVVRKLRPVSFRWKAGGQNDVGLIAEEVNQVEPLLVTRNKQGEIQGVKYDRLNVVLLNAINEQQQTIAQLEKQNLILKAHSAKQEARLTAVETRVKRLAQHNRRQRRHQ